MDVGVLVAVPVLVAVRVLDGVLVAGVCVPAGVLVGVLVRVGVAGGTAGKARAMALTNASTVLSMAAASLTVAQLPFASAFWKAVERAVPAFVRHV